MKNDLIMNSSLSCCKIVFLLLTLFLIYGCGGGGDDSPFKASDGEYSIESDNDAGGYFEVIDNKIYNLRFWMTRPSTDENCAVITGQSLTRPGESDPFMEFVSPVNTDPIQEIKYFDPIKIDEDGKILVEEYLFYSTSEICDQLLTISGGFQDADYIEGTWQYTIEGNSTSGTWFAKLLITDSGSEPVSLPEASIIIDGDSSDWQGIQPIITDIEGDENPGSDFDGTDLKALYLARDDKFLYHMITLYDADPPVSRDLVYVVSYDKYPIVGGGSVPGDQFSSVYLNPPSDGNIVVNVGERFSSADGSDTSNQFGSDYAAVGDKFIEYKIPLENMKSIDGTYIDLYSHMLDTDDDGFLLYKISDIMDNLVQVADFSGGYIE